MKFDTVGILRVLLGETQHLPDSRYKKYIATAVPNILPDIDLSGTKRKVVKQRLFKFKNPEKLDETTYSGTLRTQTACVLIEVCIGYLQSKTDMKHITSQDYGQIRVIRGMASRMINENRRIYEN